LKFWCTVSELSAVRARSPNGAETVGFLLLTFAVTWAAWLAVESAAPNSFVFAPGGPVFLLGVFAPGLVAVALTAFAQGATGVADLLSRIGRWEVSWRLYAFAISYMAATKLLAALTHRIVVGEWPRFGDTNVALMAGAIFVSTWSQAGEEVGWRGYALPRLAPHLGLGGASLVVGVIWALWHLPLFIMQGTGSTGQSFPIYLLHVTALSAAMSWLYWKTQGSLLLVMVMHAAVNNTSGIVPAALPHATDPMSFQGSLVAWVTVGVAWVVAAVLLYQMHGAETSALQDGSTSGRA
jgi:membrane protease YdiL (CAAX protease family)